MGSKDAPRGLKLDTHSIGDVMFACQCGRCQRYSEDGKGGIDEAEARMLGWRFLKGEWVCPLCSGNTHLLSEATSGLIVIEFYGLRKPIGENVTFVPMKRAA